MDLVNRLIAWAAYVTGAVLIGSGSFFAFHYYRQASVAREVAPVALPAGERPSAEPRAGLASSERSPPVEQMYLQRLQIRRLQTLLDQKTKLLQQKTGLLDRKNAEHEALRSELDEAIDLLAVLAAEVAARDSSSGSGGTDAHWQTELERLREESQKSRMLAEQQQGELDRLKEELGATDAGISQLEQQAETDFEQLRAETSAFQAVVSETLVRIGAEAVPSLVYQLAHPRADVRQWAAVMLGELGSTAKEAIPPLQDALKDQDASVRDAARRALEKVDPLHR